MKDPFIEGMIILTMSPFNSPIWPVVKPGKDEGYLLVGYHNVSAISHSLRPPYSILLELLTPSNQQPFAVINLENLSVSAF